MVFCLDGESLYFVFCGGVLGRAKLLRTPLISSLRWWWWWCDALCSWITNILGMGECLFIVVFGYRFFDFAYTCVYGRAGLFFLPSNLFLVSGSLR